MRQTTGLERRDGHDVGRDPRCMSSAELEQLGHARMSPLKALRLKCLECSAGSAQEVRLCVVCSCPAWPFRMGKNPWQTKSSGNSDGVDPASATDMPATLTTPGKTGGNPTEAHVPGTPLPDSTVPTEKMQFLQAETAVAS